MTCRQPNCMESRAEGSRYCRHHEIVRDRAYQELENAEEVEQLRQWLRDYVLPVILDKLE